MIRLNKLTDYAIVVMTTMAAPSGARLSTAQLAERTGVPLPTISKLLKILTPAGLMVSQRGAAGGYVLSRAPEEITIADIITALDGPIALTSCVEGGEESCNVENLCPMRGGWNKLNRAIRGALESVTLADMMAPAWAPPPVPERRAALPTS
jgi:FeS assembly SUF system regulator